MLGSIGSQLGVYQLGSIPQVGEGEPEPVEILPDLVEVTAGIRRRVEARANVRIAVGATFGLCQTVHLEVVER